MAEKIYFDHNSTTKIDAKVLEAMAEVYRQPLNSSSTHHFGRAANKLLDQARDKVKKLFNAGDNYKVVFTSGGTESNNLALNGFKLITSEIEHSAVYDLAVKKNATLVNVDQNGIIDLGDLEEKLAKLKTRDFLVSVMLANNETGVIQPIKQIAKLVHSFGGLIHSDMVQAAGKIAVDLEDLNIDLASVSAHKICGSQGVGALLIRSGIDVEPLFSGSSQEGGKRPGTVNIAGAVGFGKACEIALDKNNEYKNLEKLRNYLEENLKKIAGENVEIFGQNVERLPNTSFIGLRGIGNQTQLIHFDLNNICVSIGAACSSGSSKPSRVLSAMKIDEEMAKGAIRVSLGLENTQKEIDHFIEIWGELYNRIKN
jgi:cysteine desulfurase